MAWSALTMTLFAGVAILFVAGAGLIWVGLRRKPDRLPAGADEVLDAIVSGRLAPPPARTPTPADDTGEVRLVAARPAPRPHTPLAPSARPAVPPATQPAAQPVAATAAAPATGGSTVTIVRDPRDVLAEQESDDDLTLRQRLFFAEEPQLNRF